MQPATSTPPSTSANTGVGLADNAASISQGIRNNSWVDSALNDVGNSIDMLSVALDPLGSLFAWGAASGAGWLIAQIQPLHEPLDALTGNAAAVTAHEQTWTNIAQSTSQTAQKYPDMVNSQTANWLGETAAAYRTQADDHATLLEGIGLVAGGIAAATDNFGALVAGVRTAVADLLARLATKIVDWLPAWIAAGDITFGAASPGIIAQVASLVTECASEIRRLINALRNSMRELEKKLGDLGDTLTGATHHPRLATADGPQNPLTLAMAKGDKAKKGDDPNKNDPISKWLGDPKGGANHECTKDYQYGIDGPWFCIGCGMEVK